VPMPADDHKTRFVIEIRSTLPKGAMVYALLEGAQKIIGVHRVEVRSGTRSGARSMANGGSLSA
jgi:hypothetical protein